MAKVFDLFKEKVLCATYLPTSPLDTLQARLTASSLLQSKNPSIVEQAQAFIKKISSTPSDFTYLLQLSSQIKTWDCLQICSAYTNISGNFLEYKITYTSLEGNHKTIHRHALFETNDNRCYFVSETPPLIRVIGDPVLHQPGIPFPENATLEDHQELQRQIHLAKELLVTTGGAGIAANQCAAIDKPYCFAIVGVFYDIPEQVSKVEKRYPKVNFPRASIMVNPTIISMSQDSQDFNHACLSVPCGNRCAVTSPAEISVSFQDPLDNMRVKKLQSKHAEAVVLWHELTHILDGKTYMDVMLERLSAKNLTLFQGMVDEEIQRRHPQTEAQIPELTVPPFYISVKIDALGEPQLDTHELINALSNMTEETLRGLEERSQLDQVTFRC